MAFAWENSMGIIRDKANEVYEDGPSAEPSEPPKLGIRTLFEMVEDAIENGGTGVSSFSKVSQKLLVRLESGFDNGTTDTQAYAGQQSTPQGGCLVTIDGVEYYFLMQKVSGTTWGTDETFRIVQYAMRDDGGLSSIVAKSEEILLGHQGLSTYSIAGQVYFVVGMRPTGSYTGANAGKGFSIIEWNGDATDQGDVSNVPLFGVSGSGHIFQDFATATPFLSTDGLYLHIYANDTKTTADDTAHTFFTYDFAGLMALHGTGDSLDARPMFPLTAVNGPGRENAYFLQGGASNGTYAVAARGYVAPLGYHGLQLFDFLTNNVREVPHDDARARYGRDGILNHATLGNPTSIEIEGVSFRGTDELIVLVADNWKTGCPIVTDGGKNWASIASGNLGNPPDRSPEKWVETTKAATHGAYDIDTTYGTGVNSRRDKLVYSIRTSRGEAGEQSVDAGITNRGSGAQYRLGGNSADFSFPLGDSVVFVGRSEQTGEQFAGFGFYGGVSFRGYDLRYGSDHSKYVNFGGDFSSGRETFYFRVNGSQQLGASANAYGKDDASYKGWWRFWGCKYNGPGVDGTEIEFLNYDPNTDKSMLRKLAADYDSGWVAVTSASTHVLTHNLDSKFLRLDMYLRDGSGNIFALPTGYGASSSVETDVAIFMKTTNTIELGFGNDGIYAHDNTSLSGTVVAVTSGDVRVFASVIGGAA
jgi:hypothetical protein